MDYSLMFCTVFFQKRNCDDSCHGGTLFGHPDKVTSMRNGFRESPIECQIDD